MQQNPPKILEKIVDAVLLMPTLGVTVAPVVPQPIRGEVLLIAAYLCGPNGGTQTMQAHADPERYSFTCRNEARFDNQRITLE